MQYATRREEATHRYPTSVGPGNFNDGYRYVISSSSEEVLQQTKHFGIKLNDIQIKLPDGKWQWADLI